MNSFPDGTSERGHRAAEDLTRLVPCETLQQLQDRFSDLGNVTVCLSTLHGALLTKPTWGSRFSELVGTSARGRIVFADSIRACTMKSIALEPSICHDGMTFYATAIVHQGRQLAYLVVGTRASRALDRDTVKRLADGYGIDPAVLWDSVSQIDPYHGGTPEAIRDFADVLANTIAALFGQADRIQRQLADLRTVHELSEMLSGTLDLQDILDRAVKQVVEVMAVKACAIRLLEAQTGELVIKAVYNLSQEYLRKGPVVIQENAIDAAAFAGETVYIEDVPNDPRIRYPDNARREGIVSGLCVPMTYRGQTIGVLRVYTSRRYRFSRSEESLLRSIASQAAAATINSRLHTEHAAKERFQRQVEAAAEIQRRMLPSQAPTRAGLAFGCVYEPTLDLSGDFYDFVELADGRLGICIADVVGKGLSAALMMASCRSALRGYAMQTDEVSTVVTNVNRHLCRDTLVGEFATLVYGLFSNDGRQLTYCNAGHDPPLLLRGDQFMELTSGGLVIGVCSDEAYDGHTIEFQTGDLLVFVTDGVTDAMDFQGRPYSRERLRKSIRKHRALDAQQLALQILWDVRRFVGLNSQTDDITIVVVKVLPTPD